MRDLWTALVPFLVMLLVVGIVVTGTVVPIVLGVFALVAGNVLAGAAWLSGGLFVAAGTLSLLVMDS